MTANQKSKLGTKFWLTGLVNLKSAEILSIYYPWDGGGA